jgi:hypothetical protein
MGHEEWDMVNGKWLVGNGEHETWDSGHGKGDGGTVRQSTV